jgi:hypothetical protein
MAPTFSTLVIDNASQDQTVARAKELPGTACIANAENRGFAAAVNQGIRASGDADPILLVNPDVELLTKVDELVQASRQFGLSAGKLVDQSGQPQTGFSIRRFPTTASLLFELAGLNRLWPSNFVNRRYRYLDADMNRPGPVEQPAGAFLMFRRDVWESLGGFDESFYPVWFEDVDFCRRAISAGFQIQYLPAVEARHSGGHSVLQLAWGCRMVQWCDSLLRYAAKHSRSLPYRALCLAVVLTSVPRTVVRMIRDRSLTPVTSCVKTVRSAAWRLVSLKPRTGGAETGIIRK